MCVIVDTFGSKGGAFISICADEKRDFEKLAI